MVNENVVQVIHFVYELLMARKKDPSKELKDQRIPIMMSAPELAAIDDWSFENRIRSRGEAIRRLCSMALAIDPKVSNAFEASLKLSAPIYKMYKALNISIDDLDNPEFKPTEIQDIFLDIIEKMSMFQHTVKELADYRLLASYSKDMDVLQFQYEANTAFYDRSLRGIDRDISKYLDKDIVAGMELAPVDPDASDDD